MRTIMKAVARDQEGNVMVMALILLVIGGFILTPLLGLMGTALLAGEVYEKKTDELYAADAGVEDAIWKIANDALDSYPYEYPEPLVVNNKSVNITIFRQDLDPTCGEELRYRILSSAASDDGTSTTVDAHLSVSYLDLSALLDNAIISDDTIDIKPGSEVNGDVWLPDSDDLDNKGSINGTVKDSDDMTIDWPTAEQLIGYYMEDVEDAPDPGPSIDVQYTNTTGPCYREGSLTVDNTGDPAATLTLEGTVYLTGDVAFQQAGGNHSYIVDLSEQTIFAEGAISFPSHHVTIAGSGCIIAVGDIDFQPSIAAGEDDFVLVFSVTGEVNFQPSGNFTGCVAGNAHVQLQPGCIIDWISPEGKGLDVPWGVGDIDELPPVTGTRIESWEVS